MSARKIHGGDDLRGKYHREAKIVLIGEGKFFKYEFDWSKARIPALAAVSPNLETGPAKIKLIPYERNWRTINVLTLDKCSAHALIVTSQSSILV